MIDPASRVLKNSINYILEGWEAVRQEANGLFEEEDETLDGVLAWVTAFYLQNMAALNAEEPSMAKAGGAVSKQERLDNKVSRKQLITEKSKRKSIRCG